MDPGLMNKILVSSEQEEKSDSDSERPKASYTDRLILYLSKNLEDGIDLKPIETQIKKFSRKEARKINKQEQAEINTLYFGKYKGRAIKEVYSFDAGYLLWLKKQNFIKPNLKSAIDKVIKSNPK